MAAGSVVISWRILDNELNLTTFSAIESFDVQISSSKYFETSLTSTHNIPAEERSFAPPDLSTPLWRGVIYARVWARVADSKAGERWSEKSSPWLIGADCPSTWLNTSSHTPQDWRCSDCPVGASCMGTPWSGVKAKFGYYRVPSTTIPHLFAPCLYPAACLGAPNDAQSGQYYADPQTDPQNKSTDLALANFPEMCHASWGHSNGSRLCHVCRPGFSRQGAFRCAKCAATSDQSIGISVAIVGAALLALVFYVRSSISDAQQEYAISESIKKVILNYLQVITQFSGFSLHWPPMVQSLFEGQGFVSTIGSQILNIECFSSMTPGELYYSEQVASAVAPPIVCLVIYLVWRVAAKCYNGDFGKRATAGSITFKDKWIMSTCIILYLMYPSMAGMAFGLFNCVEVETGRYFLLHNVADECFVGRHLTMAMAVGLFQIVAYVIGLPLLLFVFLFRNRHGLSKKVVTLRYGLFLNGYRKERYYWELALVARKVVVIATSVFGKSLGPQLQSHILSLALLLCLIAQSTGHPFLSKADQAANAAVSSSAHFETVHRLEMANLLVIWLTLWCGLFIYHIDRQRSGLHAVLTMVIVVANIIVMLWMAWQFAVEMVYEFKQTRKKKEASAGLKCLSTCTEKVQSACPCLKKGNGGLRARISSMSSFKSFRLSRFTSWRRGGAGAGKKTSGSKNDELAPSSNENPMHGNGKTANGSVEMTKMPPRRGSKRKSAGWVSYEDPDTGAEYFYNESTGESRWVDINKGEAPQPLEMETPEASGEDWDRMIDEETQRAYWYNVSTGESVWVEEEDGEY